MKVLIVIPIVSIVSLSYAVEHADANGGLWIGEFRQYDTSNSPVPDNAIYTITMDHSGNVWAGSSAGGLASFDGATWNVFTASNSPLPFNRILTLVEDHTNALWIGTDSGLVKYDGTEWTVFTPLNSPMKVYHVWSIAIDRNNAVWFGNGNVLEGGLMVLSGNEWKSFTPDNSILPNRVVNDLVVDYDNTVWAGTTQYQGGGGLVRIAGDSWTYYNKGNSPLRYNSIEHLALDSGGNIWVGQDGKLYLIDTLDGALLTVSADGNRWEINDPSQSGKSSNAITAITCDKRGYIWVTTSVGNHWAHSFSVYNKKRWLTFRVGEDDTSPPYYMPDIAVDKNNNIWFATDHGVLTLKQDTAAIDALFSSGVTEARHLPFRRQGSMPEHFDLLGRKCCGIYNNFKGPKRMVLESRKSCVRVLCVHGSK
jgi:ligand-binding sensor domain-containing protein